MIKQQRSKRDLPGFASAASINGLIRDTVTVGNVLDEGGQKDELSQRWEMIEKLFSEDQEYKMKLANQYDMLSYVGSEIDEVKMDHLTFVKIYNQYWGAN